MGNVQNIHGNAVTPSPLKETAFDPLFGFPNGRKERVMIATEEEMDSAKIPLDKRDYCAHELIKYHACRKRVFPFLYKCGHERHSYLNCEYEDYVIRMKEFERERRLLQRKKRIEEKRGHEEIGEC